MPHTRPVDEEADPDDEYPTEYTVKLLPGADALPKNYRFTPVYPFPYRYNSILVKLGEGREVQQQVRFDEELTDSDPYDSNQSLIAMHAESTEEGPVNVLISGRTLYRDGYWNTICLPFDVVLTGSVLDGATARPLTAASISGTTLNLTFGDAVTTLVAGTPYIIKWEAAATNIVNPQFLGVTFDATDRSYDNAAQDGGRVRFAGTYTSTTFTADKNILLMGGDNTLRYPGEGAGIGAFRAYFKIGGDDAQSAARLTAFRIDFGEEETTGIVDVAGHAGSPSAARQGASWYALDGRRLNGKPTQRGIYVNNGKKVVVK